MRRDHCTLLQSVRIPPACSVSCTVDKGHVGPGAPHADSGNIPKHLPSISSVGMHTSVLFTLMYTALSSKCYCPNILELKKARH